MKDLNKDGLFEKDLIDFFQFNRNILNVNLRRCIRQTLEYLLKKKYNKLFL